MYLDYKQRFIISFIVITTGATFFINADLTINWLLSIEELESLKTQLGVLERPPLEPPLFERLPLAPTRFERPTLDGPSFDPNLYTTANIFKCAGVVVIYLGILCLADAFLSI